jgi:hypothetical protein
LPFRGDMRGVEQGTLPGEGAAVEAELDMTAGRPQKFSATIAGNTKAVEEIFAPVAGNPNSAAAGVQE